MTSNRKTANPCWLNTLIIFATDDNSMSAEGSLNGTPNEVGYLNGYDYSVEQMLPLIPVWGSDNAYNHLAVPWAFTMDTPYRWVMWRFKAVLCHDRKESPSSAKFGRRDYVTEAGSKSSIQRRYGNNRRHPSDHNDSTCGSPERRFRS